MTMLQSHMISSAATPTSIRMLLVEDSSSDVFFMRKMLDDAELGAQFEIHDVPRLTDAFKSLGAQHFDVILLDLNLLDIDGVTAVKALCSEASGTPIIVYSGLDSERTRQEVLECGAQGYLVKGRENAVTLYAQICQAIDHANATKAD